MLYAESMRPEPEDYFSGEEAGDLSKYAKEAEKIKVISDGGRWGLQIEAQPEKPPEKKKLPKLDLKHVSKTQILMAVLVVLSMISLAYAASNLLLSRPITETIVVKAPQNVSLSLEGWNREVVIGLNYTFYIIANNPNPNLKARWLLNFTRVDGINYDDFELYYVAGNKTITLPKVREANEKLVFAYVSDLPAGSSTHQFILTPKRLGSYQVAICLKSA
jgi:hypothetical protein